jgi:hypothetical protein
MSTYPTYQIAVYTYRYVYMSHAHVFVYVLYIYAYICMYVCMYIVVNVSSHLLSLIHTYIRVCVCIYICMARKKGRIHASNVFTPTDICIHLCVCNPRHPYTYINSIIMHKYMFRFGTCLRASVLSLFPQPKSTPAQSTPTISIRVPITSSAKTCAQTRFNLE